MSRYFQALCRTSIFVFSIVVVIAGASAQQPIGRFSGTIKPSKAIPQIPPTGMPLELRLMRADGDALSGLIYIKGSSSALESLKRVPVGGYTAKSQLMGIPIDVSFELRGVDLTGKLRGTGFTLEFDAALMEEDLAESVTSRRSLARFSSLATDDWMFDLQFLERQMPVLHKGWFDHLTPASWKGSVGRVRVEIPTASPERIAVMFSQLIALRGDAHTMLYMDEAPEFASCPIEFEQFADGVYIVGVKGEERHVIGSKLLRVGGKPIDDVLAIIATARAAENDQWKRQNVRMLSRPAILYGLGILDNGDSLPLVLSTEDVTHELVLSTGKGRLVRSADDSGASLPLSRRNRSKSYWFEFDEMRETLYVAYNRCFTDPKQPFIAFAADVVEAAERRQPKRVFIDLRSNGGGSSMLLEPVIAWIAGHQVLNHPSRTFVAIGKQTFSSAMLNAVELRGQTRATLIGEPTGGKPNAYGEVRNVRLPKSGLLVTYSTQYFRSVAGNPPSVDPDRAVVCSAEDYFSGHDPVLAAAAATEPEGKPWQGAVAPVGIAGSWRGGFVVPEAMRSVLPGGMVSYSLAVMDNGEVQAALNSMLIPALLTDLRLDASRRVLEGRVALARFPKPVRVRFEFGEHTLRCALGDAKADGWGIRTGRDPQAMIVRARFESIASDSAKREQATGLGHRLVALWCDRPIDLNTLAWRLLTEPEFGGRFDSVALAASRRSDQQTESKDWQNLDTLALAEFRMGNTKRAVSCARRALELCSGDQVRSVTKALRRYEAALSK